MAEKSIELSDFEKMGKAGDGASGEVFKARPRRQLSFAGQEDLVALKVYKDDLLKVPSQRERIDAEYQTGSRLVHANLVKIYHADITRNPPFLVMEWCEGEDLLKWRQSHAEPTEEFLLQFATEMLDALEFLHSTRRYHRDVKLSNIHIDSKGRIRLLDYGIIRSLRDPSLTAEGARFVGTYRYSAPEYIAEDTYSYPADLYSFGAVLYYLLHGKEIFAGVQRTPDMINAKRIHTIHFEDKLRGKGPIWSALMDLSRQLLEPTPALRPSSALACLDILYAAVPSEIPLRAYFGCALTRGDESRRQLMDNVGHTIREAGVQNSFSLYMPAGHTHPLGAPNLSAAEVYWIDRERVASSDLLVIFADDPSFGVGQEAEIAANAGVPIVLFYSKGINVSRMLRGIAGRMMAEIEFDDSNDLASKALSFFKRNKPRLELSRRSREREYNVRLGNRVREARNSLKLEPKELAERAGVSEEQINALESRPEQQSSISLLNLRRVARALEMSPAELLRDQGGKDQLYEDLLRESKSKLREFAGKHQLSYDTYSKLQEKGREVLRDQLKSVAARGASVEALDLDDWKKLYGQSL